MSAALFILCLCFCLWLFAMFGMLWVWIHVCKDFCCFVLGEILTLSVWIAASLWPDVKCEKCFSPLLRLVKIIQFYDWIKTSCSSVYEADSWSDIMINHQIFGSCLCLYNFSLNNDIYKRSVSAQPGRVWDGCPGHSNTKENAKPVNHFPTIAGVCFAWW